MKNISRLLVGFRSVSIKQKLRMSVIGQLSFLLLLFGMVIAIVMILNSLSERNMETNASLNEVKNVLVSIKDYDAGNLTFNELSLNLSKLIKEESKVGMNIVLDSIHKSLGSIEKKRLENGELEKELIEVTTASLVEP